MEIPTHFANILLTHDQLIGRMRGPTRKKGDWFHSISVFTKESVADIAVGKKIPCTVIHFYGVDGSPVLDTLDTFIKCTRVHLGKKVYVVSSWSDDIGVIGEIRTLDGYKFGCGQCNNTINSIISAAFSKWGNNKIPYAHQKSESYNCVAFVDDIFEWCDSGNWNTRIESMHQKYGLFI